jgi:hypothetical protein
MTTTAIRTVTRRERYRVAAMMQRSWIDAYPPMVPARHMRRDKTREIDIVVRRADGAAWVSGFDGGNSVVSAWRLCLLSRPPRSLRDRPDVCQSRYEVRRHRCRVTEASRRRHRKTSCRLPPMGRHQECACSEMVCATWVRPYRSEEAYPLERVRMAGQRNASPLRPNGDSQ